MTDFKLSEESAEAALELFTEYYEIDVDDIPGEAKAAVEGAMKRIVKGIRRGRIEIKDEDGVKVILNTKGGSELTFGELTGKAKTAMGKKKETDHYGRIYALCGAMTGVGETGILKLKGADLSACECVGTLFLQV